MKKLAYGIYEQLINELVHEKIIADDNVVVDKEKLDEAEASDILAKYLAEVAKKSLELVTVKDGKGPAEDREALKLRSKVKLVNDIIALINQATEEDGDISGYQIPDEVEQLLAVYNRRKLTVLKGGKKSLVRPETSIASSSLFTGAVREPQLQTELKKEIASSDSICMLVSFIKWSGLIMIIDELRNFTANGGKLKVITTSYMGATDVKAVRELSKLPNTEIKVSYDTKRTRLHAKSYIFFRNTGFNTAYIGSSNISNAALTSGLEWNVKITQKDQAETLEKVKATFVSYWNSKEFESYKKGDEERLREALRGEKYKGSQEEVTYFFDLQPYAYQQEILDKLEAERVVRGFNKNLLIAATGTGKTMVAAFDYKRFKRANPKRARLLFVAHREEILKQSLMTFRMVLRDQNFGDLLVGNNKPERLDHLFVSIQSFNAKNLTSILARDFYDYIVVDEFHHAAAPTYQDILNYFQPQIMLGLTATPERMDGKHNELYEYFDNRVAAEIRLTEAIDRKLLCPFQYFGVTDEVDISNLKWTRGGYDVKALNNVYVLDGVVAERRAENILASTLAHINEIDEVKGLGFCVSVEHARFMADFFNKQGIASIALTGNSDRTLRNNAKQDLLAGKIKFIFVVDIYNEGVDIPAVNTVLFLRPTESLTIFLQQLGRGLRLAEGKDYLTVLDFIGQANKRYNFEDKFRAILNDDARSVAEEIKKGFVAVPKGCYIHLEKKARDYVLANIKASLGSKQALVNKIINFTEETGEALNLTNFLNYYKLSLKDIYAKYSFGELCELAGKYKVSEESAYEVVKKAGYKLTLINSRRFINFIKKILVEDVENSLGKEEELMLQMLQYTLWNKDWRKCGFQDEWEGIRSIKNSPRIRQEILAILDYSYNNIDFIDEALAVDFVCPLDLYCDYTRDQILLAMETNTSLMEGVKYIKAKNVDLFFITLNKAARDYSPTTMYEDYSINEYLFHWQSQSKTSESSPTGQRYINHRKNNHKIILFVREDKRDKQTRQTGVYTCLGTASYVSHEGSRPMSIIWRLDRPIPAKFLKKTNKALLG